MWTLLMDSRVSWRAFDLFGLQHFPLKGDFTISPYTVNTLSSKEVTSFSKIGKDVPFFGVLPVTFDSIGITGHS